MRNRFRLACVTGWLLLICGCQSLLTPEPAGTGGVVHGAVRAQLDPAHAQRIIGITDDGDRGLIALQACQAYVREVTK